MLQDACLDFIYTVHIPDTRKEERMKKKGSSGYKTVLLHAAMSAFHLYPIGWNITTNCKGGGEM